MMKTPSDNKTEFPLMHTTFVSRRYNTENSFFGQFPNTPNFLVLNICNVIIAQQNWSELTSTNKTKSTLEWSMDTFTHIDQEISTLDWISFILPKLEV